VVKMRGVQVNAGIFDENIHDFGVECVSFWFHVVDVYFKTSGSA